MRKALFTAWLLPSVLLTSSFFLVQGSLSHEGVTPTPCAIVAFENGTTGAESTGCPYLDRFHPGRGEYEGCPYRREEADNGTGFSGCPYFGNQNEGSSDTTECPYLDRGGLSSGNDKATPSGLPLTGT